MTSEIGERIKRLRNNKGWSLRELEKRANINYSVLSRIEAGKRPVTDSEILIFSSLFSVSPNFLLGFNEEEKPKNENLIPFDLVGISLNDFENLSAYQQEVLQWAASESGPNFMNRSENVLDMMEQLEIAYEVYKAMQNRKNKR